MDVQQHLHIMPPESLTSQPLTLLPTDEKMTQVVLQIVQETKNRKYGRGWSDETWLGYTVNEKEYVDVLQLLQSDESVWGYWEDKVRYELSRNTQDRGCLANVEIRHYRCDYFPSIGRFVLRRTTVLHGTVVSRVVREPLSQLDSIASLR